MKNSKLTSKSSNKFLSGIIFLCLLISPVKLFTQEETEDKTSSPYFLVLSDDPSLDQLPLKSTGAEVNIVGVIADVTITQVYKNEGKKPLEAIYTFPASTNAALYAMEMTIGNRKIIAKVEEKQKARNDYEQAKSEGKRTSLLEQERPNVFQMNVANIMPGDDIKVSLKYTEMLIPEGGVYKFVYPTVVGPRYTGESGTTTSPSSKFTNTPYQKAGNSAFYNFNINVNISAGMPIQNVTCKSHKVSIQYPQSSMAKVNLDKSENKGGNRDFILEYQLAGSKVESGLMLYENGDENFFLLMVQPPKKVLKEDIPPREYIFIVDVSGSMGGYPIDISKKLMRNLVADLRPSDKFNVMVFAGNYGWLSKESLAATPENVEKAIQFVERQDGNGGTNLLAALKEACALPKTDGSLSRSFVILSDGYVDVEKEAFDLVRNNNDKANTFAFGIGTSVNRYLIEGFAHVGMGEPFVVTNENEANPEAEKFRTYINSPVLTQIKSVFNKFGAYDVEPVKIPDLFAERPIIIFGKYKGAAKGSIQVSGKCGKKNYSKTFNVSEVKPDKKNSALRYLWARKRIQLLDDYNNIASDSIKIKEVTSQGLKYNLLTTYTSFIAIEEDKVVNNGKVTTVKQPLPMPEGVPNSAVGFELGIDGEVDYEIYQDIKIKPDIPESIKTKIQVEIEKKIFDQLNTILSNDNTKISSIEVIVDALGKVKSVSMKGKKVNSDLQKKINEVILKWDFSNYGVKKQWEFKILL